MTRAVLEMASKLKVLTVAQTTPLLQQLHKEAPAAPPVHPAAFLCLPKALGSALPRVGLCCVLLPTAAMPPICVCWCVLLRSSELN